MQATEIFFFLFSIMNYYDPMVDMGTDRPPRPEHVTASLGITDAQ